MAFTVLRECSFALPLARYLKHKMMENISVLKSTGDSSDKTLGTNVNRGKISHTINLIGWKNEILICEDNKLAMKALSVVLEREGFKADSAVDGNEALSLLQKNVYNLIIVDIHLPYHSGLELVKYLRSDLKKNTPVLIVTAFSDPQMQRQAGELGINGYVTKPFNPSDLVNKIRSILTSELCAN